MSDTWFIFVPADPAFSPELGCEENAITFIQETFSPTEINVERTDHIEFYYLLPEEPHFLCPQCKTLSGIDFLDDIYTNEKGVPAQFAANCCNEKINIKDVRIFADAEQGLVKLGVEVGGFARFAIRCLYPDNAVRVEDLSRLSEYIGCPMRALYQHF